MNFIEEKIPDVEFPTNKIPVAYPLNESFMYLDDYFVCDSKYNHWKECNGRPIPGSSSSIIARKTVVEKLLQAQKLLPKGYRFKVYDAYRPIIVQQKLWDFYYEKEKEKNPDKNEKELEKLTAFWVSKPSYNVLAPSLHNTGGAIDLTIIDENDKELNMGCEFDDFSDRAWTNHFEKYEKNEEVRNNRRLLYNIMLSVGFTNLPSEWWHYDYGDDKWAQFYHTAPLYCGVLDANVRNMISYKEKQKILEISEMQYDLIVQLVEIRDECEKLAKTVQVHNI